MGSERFLNKKQWTQIAGLLMLGSCLYVTNVEAEESVDVPSQDTTETSVTTDTTSISEGETDTTDTTSEDDTTSTSEDTTTSSDSTDESQDDQTTSSSEPLKPTEHKHMGKNFRVRIKKNTTLYDHDDLQNNVEDKPSLGNAKNDQIFTVRAECIINGEKYYKVVRKNVRGWLPADNTAAFNKVKTKTTLLTGINDYNYYRDFEWTKKGTISVGRTYQTDGYYKLGDGTKYYSIYRKNSKGKTTWYGYVNAKSLRTLTMKKKSQLLTATKEYDRYTDFYWKKRGGVSKGTVYRTTGYYQLGNGEKYYSIYREDKKGKRHWYGYANTKSFRTLTMKKKSQLLTATNNYDRYSNFYWKKRGEISKGTVYHTPGYYTLGNGKKYYSVYREDKKGKRHWYGYANAKSFRALTMKKQNKVMKVKASYKRYSNFYWKYRGTAPVGKVYYTKGYYTLGNGAKYYSLYDNKNGWYGYINAKALRNLNHEDYYFSQKSKAWNKYCVRYTSSTMYDIGCAPTSLAMAMNIMKQNMNYTNPWKIADAMARYGVLRDYGTDASYNVLPGALNALGFKARYISVSDAAVKGALKKGHMVLLNGAGRNPFTGYGHFILASKISASGKSVYILDPWQSNNNGWWRVSTLRNAGLCRAFEIWI